MPGKLYENDVRLAKAFAEGQDAAIAGDLVTTNPHPTNSPANAAWAAGWADGDTLSCDVYAGGAACGVQDTESPSPPLVMTLNKTTTSIAVAGADTITATLTQGGVAQAGKAVLSSKSGTKFNVTPASATSNASGVSSFTVTGVSAGVAELYLSFGGITKTCVVTVT